MKKIIGLIGGVILSVFIVTSVLNAGTITGSAVTGIGALCRDSTGTIYPCLTSDIVDFSNNSTIGIGDVFEGSDVTFGRISAGPLWLGTTDIQGDLTVSGSSTFNNVSATGRVDIYKDSPSANEILWNIGTSDNPSVLSTDEDGDIDGAGNKLVMGSSAVALSVSTSGVSSTATAYHKGGIDYNKNPSANKVITFRDKSGDDAVYGLDIIGQPAWPSAVTNIDGGPVSITGGAGASGSAGDADGEDVILSGGTGYGTGHKGQVVIAGAVKNTFNIVSSSSFPLNTEQSKIRCYANDNTVTFEPYSSAVMGAGTCYDILVTEDSNKCFIDPAASETVWYAGTAYTNFSGFNVAGEYGELCSNGTGWDLKGSGL